MHKKVNKRVLFISHDTSRTGAPLVLLTLLKAIKKEHPDIEADLLVIAGGDLYEDFGENANFVQLKKQNIFIKKIKRNKTTTQTNKYDFKYIKSRSYNCIFANTVVSLPLAVILKEELNICLLLYVHEASFIMKIHNVSTQQLQQCDMIIATSTSVKNTLLFDYHINENNIKIIHPPLSNNIKTHKKAQIHQSHNRITIGLSGTGGWGKGLDLLPLIINQTNNKYPELNCHYIWVGDICNEKQEEIEFDLKKWGLNDKLTIIGNTEFPIEYYTQFDIFLLLSREESFSLACAECIELRKPVICMRETSGIIEDIIGYDGALVVPYLSINDISDAIYRLSTNKQLYNTIANKAIQKLESNYSSLDSINSIIELLN